MMEHDLPQEFRERLETARRAVAEARKDCDKRALVGALKQLANIERRVPSTREDANKTYAEVAELYRELDEPLEAACAIRHIGINHEYAEKLAEAERCCDQSLDLFRKYATDNSLNYANTVRYPAVVKQRLGKRDESRQLWEETCERYELVNIPVGVAEAAAWLTIFAIENGDKDLAHKWFAKAETAAAAARDSDTDKFMAEVRAQLDS